MNHAGEIYSTGKIEFLVIHQKHVYSDEEIYQMKSTMSWKRLHEKTNIPLSTLQYRYRKYKNYLSEQGGNNSD